MYNDYNYTSTLDAMLNQRSFLVLNTLKQFVCIKNKSTNHHKGFTIVELILILGIIGVIAAFTMPTLIAKCQQYIIENRMKHTYALLQDVFSRSEADFEVLGNSEVIEKNVSTADSFINFVSAYMLPYLKNAKLYAGDNKLSLRQLGYKDGIRRMNSSAYWAGPDVTPTCLRLSSGVTIFTNSATYVTSSEGAKYYLSFRLIVDVNGPSGPNMRAVDTSNMIKYKLAGPIFLEGEANATKATGSFSGDTYTFSSLTWETPTDAEIRAKCYSSEVTCGTLIKRNNWKFPKDYPYQF